MSENEKIEMLTLRAALDELEVAYMNAVIQIGAPDIRAGIDAVRLAASATNVAHGPEGNEGYCYCGVFAGPKLAEHIAKTAARPAVPALDEERLARALRIVVPDMGTFARGIAANIAREYAAEADR